MKARPSNRLNHLKVLIQIMKSTNASSFFKSGSTTIINTGNHTQLNSVIEQSSPISPVPVNLLAVDGDTTRHCLDVLKQQGGLQQQV